MRSFTKAIWIAGCATGFVFATPVTADVFHFATNSPDGRMAAGSRPGTASGPLQEIEAADDFVTTANITNIVSASFLGLIPTGSSVSSISQVDIELYRVFSLDSVNPPDGKVPTRVNSPSDNAFAIRDSAVPGELLFTASLVGSFTASNSVLNGISAPCPCPPGSPTTGGEGPVTGQEVQFNITFTTPFTLGPDHYFFIPQVLLTNGNFLWLSASRPIVSPGTPFNPDLQAWIRNASIDPDWLRIGTDIVGGATPPTFNMNFTLDGTSIPEPGGLTLALALVTLVAYRHMHRKTTLRP
jgi:hypothetical protein